MKPYSSVAGNEATALGRSNIKRQERTAAPAISIQRIHLAFKTHLDVGYTDLAREVAKRYFELYVPRAIHLAQTLRQAGEEKRFIWTTGSWLIYEYLERASRSDRARMEQAILDGDIVWHGSPFTVFSELMDADLFRFGLSLSQELDRRFGKRTIAAKMTDVPGHTRGIVPLLAEAGIQFLHIGVNAGSTPPAVPPVFVWRDPSGTQVIVMLHKGGYGDILLVPGLDEALWFAHTDDNTGPQSLKEVEAVFRAAHERFPGAQIAASTMDAFAAKLVRIRRQLPVVTDELGDTWIQGVGTDPLKVSQFRELLRLRRQWFVEGQLDPASRESKEFHRALLLVPEHTWGLDVKTHLADFGRYASDEFRAARSEPKYQKLESSWAEQRAYVRDAVEALGASQLASQARQALKAIEPARPDRSGFDLVAARSALFKTKHFDVAFDKHGALCFLLAQVSRRNWATEAHPLGLFRYEAFSQSDYERFYDQYIINKAETERWAVPDFTKPGMAASGAKHREWLPKLSNLYHRRDGQGHHFFMELVMARDCSSALGCPPDVTVEVTFPEDEPAIRFTLQWFDKPACRLPEALWFSFCPRVRLARGWTMDKLGQPVSPLEVVKDGNRKLHAVCTGVHYRDPRDELWIETLDAPLIAPGERSLLKFDNRLPALKKGMHFALFNNVWGTNFPMWYDENARFRFILRFKRCRPGTDSQ